MKKIIKKLLIVIVIINSLGMILECTNASDNSKNTITNSSAEKDRLQTIKEKGVITVASPLSDISYFYIDPNTNEIAGIEADIIREVVKRLGIDKIETKNVSLNALNDQKIDAGIVDSVILKYSLLNNSNLPLRILKDYTPELTGNVGISVRRTETTLLKALNEKINEMKEDGILYAILIQNGLDKNNMA